MTPDPATPLLIHIGYHKTATTWMQHKLFVPAFGYHPIMTHQEVFDLITRPHGLTFDPAPVQTLIAARSADLPAGAVAVISSEILSGHPFYGGRESDVFAARLAAIAPGARILITTRAQMRILPSVYMQYLSRGGTMTAEAFFADAPSLGFPAFAPEHFDYDLLVGCYQRLFGADAVHVGTQEHLSRDRDGFVAALKDFAGNHVETARPSPESGTFAPSYPEYAAPILRRINHLQSGPAGEAPIIELGRNPDGLYRRIGYLMRSGAAKALLGKRTPVSDVVKARFTGRYSASNRRLAEMLPPSVDLSKYV